MSGTEADSVLKNHCHYPSHRPDSIPIALQSRWHSFQARAIPLREWKEESRGTNHHVFLILTTGRSMLHRPQLLVKLQKLPACFGVGADAKTRDKWGIGSSAPHTCTRFFYWPESQHPISRWYILWMYMPKSCTLSWVSTRRHSISLYVNNDLVALVFPARKMDMPDRHARYLNWLPSMYSNENTTS